MQNDTLQRLLDLTQKTGDRIVVTDPAGESPYVLMSLDQYEQLIDEKSPTKKVASKDVFTPAKPSRRPTLQVAEDLDPPIDLSASRKKREIPLWKPSVKPKKAEKSEVIAETVEESDAEEQFYLEPLE